MNARGWQRRVASVLRDTERLGMKPEVASLPALFRKGVLGVEAARVKAALHDRPGGGGRRAGGGGVDEALCEEWRAVLGWADALEAEARQEDAQAAAQMEEEGREPPPVVLAAGARPSRRGAQERPTRDADVRRVLRQLWERVHGAAGDEDGPARCPW